MRDSIQGEGNVVLSCPSLSPLEKGRFCYRACYRRRLLAALIAM